MPKHVWKISLMPRLSEEQSNMPTYGIAAELGMSETTVRKFMRTETIITNQLSPNVALLAKYFDIDMNDIVSLVSKSSEDNEEGIQKRHFPRKFPDRPVSAQLIST